jgi:deferrochelatase/peroxidase EfeB
VTFGFGPSFFDRPGLGLAARRPAALHRLEALPGDELEPERSDGDVCVQACADDPQVAFHAVRNLARIGRGIVVMRWSQLGFGKTARTSLSQATPRNLMGFKDGTNNLTADEPEALAEHVWVGREGGWLRGGSYMVCRRIRMRIEVWDRASLQDQQATIGRHKGSGAPLGGRQEKDALDLARRATGGEPVIPADAHVRHAAPATNGGVRLLRRGYSFTDGFDPETGHLDAGLFFISFQRDPDRFAEVQRRLGRNDALNEYIKHTSSAVFAVPPGVRSGDTVGEGIFA